MSLPPKWIRARTPRGAHGHQPLLRSDDASFAAKAAAQITQILLLASLAAACHRSSPPSQTVPALHATAPQPDGPAVNEPPAYPPLQVLDARLSVDSGWRFVAPSPFGLPGAASWCAGTGTCWTADSLGRVISWNRTGAVELLASSPGVQWKALVATGSEGIGDGLLVAGASVDGNALIGMMTAAGALHTIPCTDCPAGGAFDSIARMGRRTFVGGSAGLFELVGERLVAVNWEPTRFTSSAEFCGHMGRVDALQCGDIVGGGCLVALSGSGVWLGVLGTDDRWRAVPLRGGEGHQIQGLVGSWTENTLYAISSGGALLRVHNRGETADIDVVASLGDLDCSVGRVQTVGGVAGEGDLRFIYQKGRRFWRIGPLLGEDANVAVEELVACEAGAEQAQLGGVAGQAQVFLVTTDTGVEVVRVGECVRSEATWLLDNPWWSGSCDQEWFAAEDVEGGLWLLGSGGLARIGRGWDLNWCTDWHIVRTEAMSICGRTSECCRRYQALTEMPWLARGGRQGCQYADGEEHGPALVAGRRPVALGWSDSVGMVVTVAEGEEGLWRGQLMELKPGASHWSQGEGTGTWRGVASKHGLACSGRMGCVAGVLDRGGARGLSRIGVWRRAANGWELVTWLREVGSEEWDEVGTGVFSLGQAGFGVVVGREFWVLSGAGERGPWRLQFDCDGDCGQPSKGMPRDVGGVAVCGGEVLAAAGDQAWRGVLVDGAESVSLAPIAGPLAGVSTLIAWQGGVLAVGRAVVWRACSQ